MEFYAILDQIVHLLRRRGRVSYRALQRQFALDDALLADLKAEILYTQHAVVEDGDRGLVWTGDPGTPAEPATPLPQPVPLPDTHAELPAAAPHPAEAERRQLTVLFCDLVDSTALASQLDPEDLREVVRAYQATCAEVIQRFDGHIAQYLGDGLLVYFGYPQAHEDDAQRAVRTGLGMVEAMATLNSRLGQRQGVRLAVRVGIHTGLVVVGEMGGGGRQEQLALGDTPEYCGPPPGAGGARYRRHQCGDAAAYPGLFYLPRSRGPRRSKAWPRPSRSIRSCARPRCSSASTSRRPAASRRWWAASTKWALLRERWAQVQAGRGHIVVLSGEAGIGKSRLVQVVKDEIIGAAALRIEYRCSPYHQHSALYPVIAHLERVLAWRQDDTPEDRLRKLEEALRPSPLPLAEVVPLFAALLSLPLPAVAIRP